MRLLCRVKSAYGIVSSCLCNRPVQTPARIFNHSFAILSSIFLTLEFPILLLSLKAAVFPPHRPHTLPNSCAASASFLPSPFLSFSPHLRFPFFRSTLSTLSLPRSAPWSTHPSSSQPHPTTSAHSVSDPDSLAQYPCVEAVQCVSSPLRRVRRVARRLGLVRAVRARDRGTRSVISVRRGGVWQGQCLGGERVEGDRGPDC